MCKCACASVCVCIYACVRECAAEAPRVCFIIHTHVWILFQPTDTCQRYTLQTQTFPPIFSPPLRCLNETFFQR